MQMRIRAEIRRPLEMFERLVYIQIARGTNESGIKSPIDSRMGLMSILFDNGMSKRSEGKGFWCVKFNLQFYSGLCTSVIGILEYSSSLEFELRRVLGKTKRLERTE